MKCQWTTVEIPEDQWESLSDVQREWVMALTHSTAKKRAFLVPEDIAAKLPPLIEMWAKGD